MEYEYLPAHTINSLAWLASWTELWQSQCGMLFWEIKKFTLTSVSPDIPGTEEGPLSLSRSHTFGKQGTRTSFFRLPLPVC